MLFGWEMVTNLLKCHAGEVEARRPWASKSTCSIGRSASWGPNHIGCHKTYHLWANLRSQLQTCTHQVEEHCISKMLLDDCCKLRFSKSPGACHVWSSKALLVLGPAQSPPCHQSIVGDGVVNRRRKARSCSLRLAGKLGVARCRYCLGMGAQDLVMEVGCAERRRVSCAASPSCLLYVPSDFNAHI